MTIVSLLLTNTNFDPDYASEITPPHIYFHYHPYNYATEFKNLQQVPSLTEILVTKV